MRYHKLLKQLVALTIATVILIGCSGGTPTYAQVLKTYPNDVKLCKTEASIEAVTADGDWKLNGTFDFQAGYECYGTKITANVLVEIGDQTYEPGTKLTVDKDLQWVEISSWD